MDYLTVSNPEKLISLTKLGILETYMEKKNLTEHRYLILILIGYSVLAIFSISYHHYHLGADGISYFSIASKYINGDWFNAINAYWSPLYSWLIAPILFFTGNDPFYAAYVTRIASFIFGFFTIIGMNRLCSSFKLNKLVKRTVLITTIPMILFYSIKYDTPDVLVLCLLVYYFSFIFSENYADHKINGIICGFLGGVGFLSKTYIFPFFTVHFILFNLFYYLKGMTINKKGVQQNFLLGMIVFLTISGLWIGTLSLKYDKLTIGTATEYNYAITGPEYSAHPVYFMGLIKPPNDSATSTWEEPSLVNLSDWSPFESGAYFKYQMETFSENLFKFTIFIEYYSILSLAIIILSLYFIIKQKTRKSFKTRLIYIMITIFIYSSGYLLIDIQDRYIWPVIILLMFCGFYLLDNMHNDKILSLKLRNVYLILLMISFILAPVMKFTLDPTTDVNSYFLSETLKNEYNIHGHIASNENWEPTNRIAFYLNSQYYGLPKNVNKSNELEKELLANNITYYFVWGDSSDVNLPVYKEITNGKIQGLKIYQHKNV